MKEIRFARLTRFQTFFEKNFTIFRLIRISLVHIYLWHANVLALPSQMTSKYSLFEIRWLTARCQLRVWIMFLFRSAVCFRPIAYYYQSHLKAAIVGTKSRYKNMEASIQCRFHDSIHCSNVKHILAEKNFDFNFHAKQNILRSSMSTLQFENEPQLRRL